MSSSLQNLTMKVSLLLSLAVSAAMGAPNGSLQGENKMDRCLFKLCLAC